MTASARGLFRATGHKSKPTVQIQLDGSLARVEEGLDRETNDHYPTPVEPIRAFIHAEIEILRQFPLIWGPACGAGAIGRELRAVGLKTYDSDLIDRGCPGAEIKDYYEYQTPPARAVVENPPFSECNWRDGKARWMYHGLDNLDLDYMALLLNWGWPGAGGLAPFWDEHPPARIYLMRFKVDFTGQGAPPMLNCWAVWDKQWKGETALRMLDRKDARQGELL